MSRNQFHRFEPTEAPGKLSQDLMRLIMAWVYPNRLLIICINCKSVLSVVKRGCGPGIWNTVVKAALITAQSLLEEGEGAQNCVIHPIPVLIDVGVIGIEMRPAG